MHGPRPDEKQPMAGFPPEVVQGLMRIAWWNWPIGQVGANLPALMGADLDALRAAQAAGAPPG